MRGKNSSSNVIPAQTRILIKGDIESFPVKESHYSGRQRQYLDAKLNLTVMYQLFKDKHPNTKVSYQFYAKFFKDNFGLSFGRSQVDFCYVCEELKFKLRSPHLNDAAKRCAAAELLVHNRDYWNTYILRKLQWVSNNHSLSRLLLAMTDTRQFNKTEHFFMPCDRDFGIIKRYIKRHDRFFSVHELTELIIASSNTHIFIVKEITYADILDFKKWRQPYYKKNCISEETFRKSVQRDKKIHYDISNMMNLSYNTEVRGTIVAREFINGVVSHTFRLAQPGETSTILSYGTCLPIRKGSIENGKNQRFT
ncbi:hypothetical protein PR048_023850 [Dryococelus australis]|uniref:Uncharacterized protein n=1 Tax=Dryococelus australis TaxID=614101 RepID=A0ABQ9GV92_9NEOP|nr:hypothetical protein PR048_023850 [Dryococelus australis]